MVKIKQTKSFAQTDLLILPFFEAKTLVSKKVQNAFSGLKTIFDFVKQHDEFEGKEGEMMLFHTTLKKYPRVLLVGLGKESDLNMEHVRRLGGNVRRKCASLSVKNVSCVIFGDADLQFPFAEGFVLAGYQFSKYKPKKKSKKKELQSLTIVTDKAPKKSDKEKMAEALKVLEAVMLVRDLINTPANDLNPTSFSRLAKRFDKASRRIKTKIVTAQQLKKMGAGAIMAVGQGSKHPPMFVVLEYKSKKRNAKTVGLLGKGITFDTGGINLKPTGHIETMKMDMGGAATVLSMFHILPHFDVPVNVTGILAIAENSVSRDAIRPGDYIKSLSGQTVEILNTDAEGRLVMADALHYLQTKLKVDTILDFATLTGACISALGYDIAATVSNSDALVKQLEKASEITNEKTCRLPLDPDLVKMVKGDHTDLKNYTAGVGAGTIMAACFLNAFILKKTKWLHFDIAGIAWSGSNKHYKTKGGTGAIVRTIWQFLKNYQ